MEPQFKTSFIPKKPIQSSAGKIGSDRKEGVNFLMLIGVIIFLVAVLLTAGVFAYKQTIKSSINAQIRTLDKAQQAFDPVFIGGATRLNERIVNANKLLNGHLAPSAIFKLLQDFTLKTVSFQQFDFEDGEDGTIKVLAKGEGDSFRSIVLQSDKFGESGYMRDVLFSDLEPNNSGNVNFSFEASIDPQLVLYKRSIRTIETKELPTSPKPKQDDPLGIFGN